MAEMDFQSQSDVAETLLIPLYVRAQESQRPDAMLKDARAEVLVRQLHYDPARFKLHGHDQVAIILRLRQFDHHARDFLACHPDAVVVHIGCGLDTRFERVDNGLVEWYDLDLPEVIALRRKLIGAESGRYHYLAASVFHSAWIQTVRAQGPRPVLFLAEGVLPYFEAAQVKALFLAIRAHFPGAELVCDAHSPFIVWIDNLQLAFSKLKARLHWKLSHARDVEGWGEGIRLLDEWYYFDRPEPRLGASQWMRYFPLFAKATGIFHYRLGERG